MSTEKEETSSTDNIEIDIETFKVMVDVRYKALELAIQMPNSKLPSTIYKKALEIEKWLTRK